MPRLRRLSGQQVIKILERFGFQQASQYIDPELLKKELYTD